MCGNPLVLSMYVAEHERYRAAFATQVRLPDSRAEFYKAVIGELLVFRRQEQTAETGPTLPLRRSRQEVLGRIALDHLVHSDDPANSINFGRAVAIAKEYWHLDTDADAIVALRRLAVDTGILTDERLDESLRFIHLTICEFLAAVELAERENVDFETVLDQVVDQPESRRLWELAVFATALEKRSVRERALNRSRSRGAPLELMLRMVRESHDFELSIFRDVLEEATVRLSRPSAGLWDSVWLDQVRLLLSCLADAARLPGANTPTVAEWLTDMVGAEAERLEPLFDLYLTRSPAEAFDLAAQLGMTDRILGNDAIMLAAMEHPDMVALAMGKVTAGGVEEARWTQILAEAALHHELVARALLDEPLPESMRRKLEDIPPWHAWHRFGPLAGSFYGGVLAAATALQGELIALGEVRPALRLDLLSQVNPREAVAKAWNLSVAVGLGEKASEPLRKIVAISARTGTFLVMPRRYFKYREHFRIHRDGPPLLRRMYLVPYPGHLLQPVQSRRFMLTLLARHQFYENLICILPAGGGERPIQARLPR
jgi:hypothetical protein